MISYAKDPKPFKEPVIYSGGKPTGFAKPEVKGAVVQDGQLSIQVKFKIAANLNYVWDKYYAGKNSAKFYDPQTALDASLMPCPLEDAIPENTPRLSPSEIAARTELFVRLANECVQEKYLEKILGAAVRKKNGTLHKGRVLHLAFLNCVGQDGATCSLVAVNKGDNEILVELRTQTPVTQTYIEQEFLFSGQSPRGATKKRLKEKQDEKYLQYKKMMEETIRRPFDDYVLECRVPSKNLLKTIVRDETVVFKDKRFAISTSFEFRKEICDEISKRGGKVE